MNNCVGARNAKYFVGFLWSTLLMLFWTCGNTVVYFIAIYFEDEYKNIIQKSFSKYYLILIIGGVCIFFGLVFAMYFHFYANKIKGYTDFIEYGY